MLQNELLYFNVLFTKIEAKFSEIMQRNNPENTRNHTVNGIISLRSHLGCTRRFWAGGDPYNLTLVFRMSYYEIFRSVDFALDAINQTESLQIKFPTDHEKQKSIAREYQEKSDVGFDNYVGCVDGMLVWIHMSSKQECNEIGVDQTKLCVVEKVRSD